MFAVIVDGVFTLSLTQESERVTSPILNVVDIVKTKFEDETLSGSCCFGRQPLVSRCKLLAHTNMNPVVRSQFTGVFASQARKLLVSSL